MPIIIYGLCTFLFGLLSHIVIGIFWGGENLGDKRIIKSVVLIFSSQAESELIYSLHQIKGTCDRFTRSATGQAVARQDQANKIKVINKSMNVTIDIYYILSIIKLQRHNCFCQIKNERAIRGGEKMPQNNCVKKGINDLRTWCYKNGEYGKQLESEWTGKTIDGNMVTMDAVSKGTKRKVYWKCLKCHQEWPASVKNRTSACRTGCPNCSTNFNKGRSRRGNLKLKEWCDSNEEIGKVLVEEWVGKDENDYVVTMDKLGKGSSKKVLWRCSKCGNIFVSRICDRTNKKGGSCSRCNKNSTSYPEQFIYYSFKEAFPNTRNREILWTFEYDLFVPDINLCIEYSPSFTHNKKLYRDEEKRKACENNGVDFLMIKEDEIYKNNPSFAPHCINIYVDYNDKDRILRSTVGYVFSLYNIQNKIDWKKVSDLAFLGAHGYIEYEDSIAYIYPELSQEWNYELNGSRKPEAFSRSSAERVFWICKKCGFGENGEWETLISNRTHLKQGCPACGYNWYDNKVHKNSTTVVIKGKTDLASSFPDLVKEWNYDLNKNQKRPDEYRPNSHVKVYWVCTQCGYGRNGEWKAQITQRISSKSGCPECGFNWFDKKYYNKKRGVSFEKSIAGLYSNLVEEWNQSMNGEKTPDAVLSGDHDYYYWVCKKCGYGKGGEWKNSPNSRVNQKSGCPLCGYNSFDDSFHKTTGRNVVVQGFNDVRTTCGNLWKEWHDTLNGDLLPSHFKAGSHQKIYWQCIKCGYGENGEWYKDIHSRTSRKGGCPRCSYNSFDGTFHSVKKSLYATN